MVSSASAPRLVFLHDNAAFALTVGVPLTLGKQRQGKAGAQHLCLDHPDVAPLHCQVFWDGVSLAFEALQTALPCYVNGQAVSGTCGLDDGDVLSFGPYHVEIAGAVQGSAPSPLESREPEPREARLAGVIKLKNGLTIGCGTFNDVCLDQGEDTDYPEGSFQVLIKESAKGFHIVDQGAEPAWLNGQLFSGEDLIIGDYLQIGSHSLRYDGRALVGVPRALGGELEAFGIQKSYHGAPVLKQAGFTAPSGQFIGILGPSGHGKTTLLKVISGLEIPQAGTVLINGVDLFGNLDACRSLMGYVPQDDIVHGELTVWQALEYSAYLRLPDWTSDREIQKLIAKILENLGLYRPDKNIDHTRKKLTELSGGQRKRVSVAVELLNRPQILFLDEPTSGLDPGMEFELMSTLRNLTQSGCTVICTTHVLENVFLMDSMAVIYQGQRVFQGDSTRARAHFHVDRLSEIFTCLQNNPNEWLEKMYPPANQHPKVGAPLSSDYLAVKKTRKSAYRAVRHLLSRHWTILKADPKNVLLLLGQPVLIGLLITCAAVTETSAVTKLFLAHVVTFWFGCSNAAQEIVKERAIFTREKFVGLGVLSYLLSKGFALGGIACLQALLLYSVLLVNVHHLSTALPGAPIWQLGALLLTALASTSIGLALSSWAKRQSQAILMVPLIIIPQILLAGYVFPLSIWRKDKPTNQLVQKALTEVSAITPCGAAQRVMDVSYVWRPYQDGGSQEDVYSNLNLESFDWESIEKTPPSKPGITGLSTLLAWALGGLVFAWRQLRKA